jgi:protein-S-isoprenylcysteine O-methyltransferase Ste14
MPDSTFIVKTLFLVGLIAYLVILGMGRSRNRQNVVADRRESAMHGLLSTLSFLGTHGIPLIYIFTPWLGFADYHIPALVSWIGLLFFAFSLALIRKAHIDLGSNWSVRMEVVEGQTLVTQGVYHIVRHPLYAAMWLWGIGQALALPNWIAGFAALVLFVPIYFYRVPREERMMIDHFGDEYQEYMKQTGRVLPRMR